MLAYQGDLSRLSRNGTRFSAQEFFVNLAEAATGKSLASVRPENLDAVLLRAGMVG
jgi:hypothetical protein